MTRSTVVPMALVRSCWVRASSPTNRQSRLPSSIFCFVSYPKVGPWSNSRYALSITSHHIISHHMCMIAHECRLRNVTGGLAQTMGSDTFKCHARGSSWRVLGVGSPESGHRCALEDWGGGASTTFSSLPNAALVGHIGGQKLSWKAQPGDRTTRGQTAGGTPTETLPQPPCCSSSRRKIHGIRLDNFHGQPKKLPGKHNMTTTPPPHGKSQQKKNAPSQRRT